MSLSLRDHGPTSAPVQKRDDEGQSVRQLLVECANALRHRGPSDQCRSAIKNVAVAVRSLCRGRQHDTAPSRPVPSKAARHTCFCSNVSDRRSMPHRNRPLLFRQHLHRLLHRHLSSHYPYPLSSRVNHVQLPTLAVAARGQRVRFATRCITRSPDRSWQLLPLGRVCVTCFTP